MRFLIPVLILGHRVEISHSGKDTGIDYNLLKAIQNKLLSYMIINPTSMV